MHHPSRSVISIVGLGLATLVALALLGATRREPAVPIGPLPVPSASLLLDADQPVSPTSTSRPTATVGPAVTTSPTPTPAAPALDPPPRPGPFAIDLYRDGDFVGQARADWCVPASMLTMINMIDRPGDRPRPSQAALNRLARKLSTDRLVGAGSEPEGWAGALNKLGFGPYAVQSEPTRAAALRTAAGAIRLTGRPVGLLIWRGAHAWVVSGFRSTADPAFTDDFDVTHLYVEDPWFPRVSSIWGRSRPPGSVVPIERVAEDYLAWRRPTVRYPEKDGQYVLVMPMEEVPAAG